MENGKEIIPLSDEIENIAAVIVNAAFNVHKELGPGLLEKIYEVCLAYEIEKKGLKVKRQVTMPIYYDGIVFDEGLRLDILVEDSVLIEVKAVDLVNPVWKAQVISHLHLSGLKLGFLINFNVSYIKDGIKRFRN